MAEQDLREWVQSEQPRERERIEQIHTLIREVVGTFEAGFVEDAASWPYELVESQPRADPEDVSFSTTAMIAFALSLVNGRIRSSALAPIGISPGCTGSKGEPKTPDGRARTAVASRTLNDLVDAALTKLIKDSDALDAEQLQRDHDLPKPVTSPLTNSGTFGIDDPFTLTWLLEVLRERSDHETFVKRLRKRAQERVKAVLDSDSPGVDVLQIRKSERVDHSFPVLRILQLRALLQRDAEGLSLGSVARVREYLLGRVHTQLALGEIPNSGFDTADLVFSLEGWVLTSRYEPNIAMVDRVFSVLRQAQAQNLYWRPLRPFKAMPQGLVLLPQSVEIANSLLRICTSEALRRQQYFSRNKDLLDGYSSWLLGRVQRGAFRKGRGGTAKPNEFVGWESENSPRADRIHLWQTSQALIFLQQYASLLQSYLAEEGVRRASLSRRGPDSSDKAAEDWERLIDDEPLAALSSGSDYRVIERISGLFGVGIATPPVNRPTSMLLYGPPGTGKTTIARRLAGALGFQMITVTPSDFAAEGGEAVEARAKAIFTILEEQRRTLVFFDEIDQLLLDREGAFYEKQGDLFKLLTPGMLTKLTALAEHRLVTFVIATNYIERIDRAIRRPGRIDERLPVLPPDREQRRRFFSTEVGGWESLDAAQAEILDRTLWYTRRELEGVVADLGGRDAEVRGDDLAQRLCGSLDRRPALNSHRQYKDRVDVDAGEQPLEEFALMIYEYLEVHAELPDDSWVEGALKNALPAVRDVAVREKLESHVVSGKPDG